MDSKYNPINLTLYEYNYKKWNKEESDDSTVKDDEEESYNFPPLKSDEEVKEEKRLKILPLNTLLIRRWTMEKPLTINHTINNTREFFGRKHFVHSSNFYTEQYSIRNSYR